jgi:hypothetical protein
MSKSTNTRLENLNFYGNKAQMKRRFKDIIDDLGDREITLNDIIDPTSPKQLGLKEVLRDNQATLNDLVILQQYSKAIVDSDTRAAEFLRDTKGEKPRTDIDITNTRTPISSLSDQDLADLISGLKALKEQGILNNDTDN